MKTKFFKRICIVDYGAGNVNSVKNMLRKAGVDSEIIDDGKKIADFDILILPGVGSFDNAIKKLKKNSFFENIISHAKKGKIILGICLGHQLLFESSEEGKLDGLGLIKGKVIGFKKSKNFKVPHMGWNFIDSTDELFKGFKKNKFYFVHSFYVLPTDENVIMSKTQYNINFVSSIRERNIIGVQFHPEKSHNYGLNFFTNFIKIYASK